MDDDYELVRSVPDAETFCALREAAGMSPRSVDGARRGLPNTVFGVRVEYGAGETDAPDTGGEDSDATGEHSDARTGDREVVGMARVVGDEGTVYQIADMAVHPDHQGRGLGTAMMDELVAYLDREAPPDAYVNLFADVQGFYERWGFAETAPESVGMSRRFDGDDP
jgi:ribosomal protein S18 acetylase RimI-like enzyme